jgi:hypothetical protein
MRTLLLAVVLAFTFATSAPVTVYAQGRGCVCANGHWETLPCYWDSEGMEHCPDQVWVCDSYECPQN